MTAPHSPFLKNDLTPSSFEALLLRLNSDRDRAGEKYEEIHWKLVKFFQWSSSSQAEELADETFNRVAERLGTDKDEIQDVVAFVWGVARRVKLEASRKDARVVHLTDSASIEDSLADNRCTPSAPSESSGKAETLAGLRACLRQLCAEDRRLLLTYHSPKGPRAEKRRRLARENGMTMLALRVRVNRLRFKLEECIKKRLSAEASRQTFL